ncbi:MAG: TIGR02206 family membrane protein [Planctomycetota bacterium]|nr:TIGR02206 family membrane protein [Planctomycetota bacterium]
MVAQTHEPFVLFGPAHMAVLALAAIVPAGLILWARRSGPGAGRVIRWSIALALVVNEIVYEIHGLCVDGWRKFLENYLPLHLCGVAVFLTAWTMIRPRQRVFELAYFWGLAGTVQALLTPELRFGFPEYRFIEFFLNHGLIVTGVFFAVGAMKLRPGPGSVWWAFWMTNVCAAGAGLADWAIGGSANYMYLCRPPAAASPFFFLPWPWYIPSMEVVGLALIGALYLPFRRRGGGEGGGEFP